MKINFASGTIEMTNAEAKEAGKYNSEKYNELKAIRTDYPDFKVEVRSIKKNSKKETYKGLTYDYMKDYILTHEDDENALIVLAEFSEMRQISRCHSQAKRYPVIKQWFLNKYPEIAKFGELAPATTQEDEEEFSEEV